MVAGGTEEREEGPGSKTRSLDKTGGDFGGAKPSQPRIAKICERNTGYRVPVRGSLYLQGFHKYVQNCILNSSDG